MKKITEYLGKPVLSVLESSTQGIVKDVLFDKNFKKLKFLILFEDNDLQEEKYLKINDVFNIGENAIVIKNDSVLLSKSALLDECDNPINNSVYTTSGKFLGVVSDANIDDKNNLVMVLLNNGQTINIDKILNSGKDTMFVQDDNAIVKLSNFRKKMNISTENAENIKVTILAENVESEQTSNENNSTSYENKLNEELNLEQASPINPKRTVLLSETCLPKSSTTKNNFLIGRKVQKNIYSFNHELIIKKNTKINEKIILLAKSHSKFKELSLNSI